MGWRAYCGETRRCTGVSPNRVYLPGFYSGPQGVRHGHAARTPSVRIHTHAGPQAAQSSAVPWGRVGRRGGGPPGRLLDKNTQIKVVDPTTLEFRTPDPMGSFPNAVSAQFFLVHKNGTTMTGPYKPTNLAVGQQMNAEAFADHWDGPPPLARLSVR